MMPNNANIPFVSISIVSIDVPVKVLIAPAMVCHWKRYTDWCGIKPYLDTPLSKKWMPLCSRSAGQTGFYSYFGRPYSRFNETLSGTYDQDLCNPCLSLIIFNVLRKTRVVMHVLFGRIFTVPHIHFQV